MGLDATKPDSHYLSSLGLNPELVPNHVAIIMDGNGRWAKSKGMPRTKGHIQGAEALRTVIKTCVEIGVRYLSVYTFSTENWKRPEDEVSFLMKLVRELVLKEVVALKKAGVYVKALGNIAGLPQDVQEGFRKAEEETRCNHTLQLNLMLNYGSRFELLDAIKEAAVLFSKEELASITEETFSNFLYTKGIPDPDMLIRSGGDYRLSNFMLWQASYSELFFSDVLWPDFSRDHFLGLVREYQSRQRRFGGVEETTL